jgi:hypothetical protein
MDVARPVSRALLGGAVLLMAACDNGSGVSGGSHTTGGGTGGGATTASAGSGGNPGSQVVSNGYVTAGPWQGYGFTATDPGAATITPDCSTTCMPPYMGNTFCMSGTVTGRPDYTGFAMLGWNVSQAMGGGTAMTWPVPASGGVTITVDNIDNTPLRVQLQGTDPHSSADRWCAALVSGQEITWTSFVTNCWTGGTPQNALTPGTPIQQAAILVPGQLQDLPFDVCLVNIQIQ